MEEENEEFKNLGEKFIKKYYKNWCDEKIDYLGGITPREAIKTPEGRKKLNELIEDFKEFDGNYNFNIEKFIREHLNFKK